jgi:DNA mismatch repair protein MutS
MAQAGIYVPCKKFTYKPYTAIYSRILGNDNLFKGLSTFAVEMSELRTILKSANNRSLVIGDELCSGTEIQSAISIFISGLIELYKKDCSFLFATHLHEIVNYEEILKMQKLNAFSKVCEDENTVSHEGILKIKHLSIHYDAALECIVYDRKLKDGSGSNNYGLTVCQSLYMPEEFMKTAYHIRSKYFPETSGELSHNPSKYNSQKIKGKCEICNIHIAEEIHHLREQNESNEKGFIDGFHKNHPANLSALCESCHLAMHRKGSQMNEKKVRKKTIRPPSSTVCSKETFKSEYKLVSTSSHF